MTGGTPGGQPYPGGAMPQTPPRRANSNCLIAALAGCGLLVIITIVLGIVVAKGAGGFVRDIAAAPDYKQKLIAVQSALQTYQHDHKGKYPAKLSDLVPNYLPDDSNFSYQVGDVPHRMEYTPPVKDAPDDAVVAGFQTTQIHVMNFQTQTIYVHLLKNGRIVQDQIVRQDLP